MLRRASLASGRRDELETFFAAVRDAVVRNRPLRAACKILRTPGLNQPGFAVNETELFFTAARDAVGEEPIGMGGW